LPQLSDGKNKLLVLMTSNPNDEQHGFIRGLFTSLQTKKKNDGYLLIDLETDESAGVWVAQGKTTVAQVDPQPGDTFEPAYLVIDAKGEAALSPGGTTLVFHRDPMQLVEVAGPDGKYSIVLNAEDAAGHHVTAVAKVDVKNSGLDLTLQSFKDFGLGLAFLYPFDWTDVQTYQRQDGSDELYVTDESGEMTLSTIHVEDAESLDDVAADAEAEIDSVDATAEGSEDTTVGENPGKRTTYAFTDEDGVEYTGEIVAIWIAETKQGYLFKIESPAEQAEDATKVLDQVLESSGFVEPDA